MSRSQPTKICHDHLEFFFDHKHHEIYVIDWIANKEYKLVPTGDHSLPFNIFVNRYLDRNEEKLNELIIKPPQCYCCATQLKWEDVTCPNCGKATPHTGIDWNKK